MKLYALACWGCKVETRISVEEGGKTVRPGGWSEPFATYGNSTHAAGIGISISRGDGTVQVKQLIPLGEDICPACTGKLERLRELLQMDLRPA